MSNSRQTSGRLGESIRNLMLYPFELRAQTDDCNQSDSFDASRIPTRNDYLRSQIRFLLNNIDQIKRYQGHLRGAVQDRLRDLARELRNSKGFSSWSALMFAAACLCAFAYFAHPWAKTRVFCSTCTPQTSFRVLKSYNKRDFLLQRVVDGITEPPEMRRFDEDSPLEMGFTLTYLKFEDRGSVWSVRGIDPYFRLERDRNGVATVPPNCTNVTGKPVVCDGEPKF